MASKNVYKLILSWPDDFSELTMQDIKQIWVNNFKVRKLILNALLWVGFLFLQPKVIKANDIKAFTDSAPKKSSRSFKTFLPKAGAKIESPSFQLVQILLDKQDKGEFDSYMVQVLFHGKPAVNSYNQYADRIVIDFFDAGKTAMRLAKIRGGAVEASSVEEFFYTDVQAKVSTQGQRQPIKKLVRLTLFLNSKVSELKIRDTLDRTLIHFRISKSNASKE